jgi:3-isopropylmalate/(R)-2-methylmalate dehydratase large subunit
MNKGYTGEIIRQHADGREEGDYLAVCVDQVLVHEPALALILKSFEALDAAIWNPDRVLVTVDHFAPPSTVERANLVKQVLEFTKRTGLVHTQIYEGICHQLFVEASRVFPGALVIGSDSHTTTAGALGCLATGMASTDILYTLVTGKTWLRLPDAVRVDFSGKLPEAVMGKDIILYLLGRAGEGGYLHQAIEFYDRESSIGMDDRFTICNMVVEGGAKNGLFYPDEVTEDYLKQRDGKADADAWKILPSPNYLKEEVVDVSELEPQIATPHSPANVVSVSSVAGKKVDQIFIGSCTNGRLTDLEMAARILKGHRVHNDVRLILTPASRKIYRQAIEKGYIQDLMDAGAVILNPSCGPCGGIDKGILAAGDVCLSTSNRNFKGRLGDPEAKTYLCSPLTAAAGAIKGEIADPREFF